MKAKEACGFAPEAKETVVLARERGLRVALATNPIFPMIATRQRIAWAGLDRKDFELCTTYENIGMQVFLLTDCLLNKKEEDISGYPKGSFSELQAFLKKL